MIFLSFTNLLIFYAPSLRYNLIHLMIPCKSYAGDNKEMELCFFIADQQDFAAIEAAFNQCDGINT